MKRTLLHSFALAAVLTVAASAPALAGPPWISIEYPANPFDATSRGAFLTVRTYHHGEIQSATVTGTAEGVVDGKRQSMRLDIRPGSQPGMYVVRWQRPATGRWVLVINSGTAGVSEATAVVEISPSGGVAGVTVPTRSIGERLDLTKSGRDIGDRCPAAGPSTRECWRRSSNSAHAIVLLASQAVQSPL